KAAIDDRLVLAAHRRGDGTHLLFLAAVILVLAVWNGARRRGDRQESLCDRDPPKRCLEIVDVLLQRCLAGIGDRRDADRVAAARAAVAVVELGVEFGEARA